MLHQGMPMRTSLTCNLQHVVARSNRAAKRTQHVTPNNVAVCCVEMLRSFSRGFQILGQQFCDMWSLYEIIHICTAVVDESEEWSSRYVALNCCHHLARALALFLLATYQNLPYSALRYLIPPYQGDEPNSSFLLYVQGEHQDSENIIGTFRNISGRLFIRRIISLEEKFSSPWDCRCRSIQKSRFFCTLCPCRWGRIGKALTWKKLACA